MNRTGYILKHAGKEKTGIEIGPSYNPLCPKRDGWKVYTVDHETREGLVEKFRAYKAADPEHHRFSLDTIEEVDFVWREGDIASLLKTGGVDRVDFIVASHVIEHMPCLLTFLQSLEELISPEGVISLVIPDKRREFDFLKPLSSTGDVIEAYYNGRTRHTARTAYLACFYECLLDSEPLWDRAPDISRISFKHDPERAREMFMGHGPGETSAYRDFHAWFFTPSSFELVMLELGYLGYTNLRVFEKAGPEGCEFYVHLKRGTSEYASGQLQRERLELVRRVHAELGEQPKKKVLRRIRDLFGRAG